MHDPSRTPPFSLPWRQLAPGLALLPVALALAAWWGPNLLAAPRGPQALALVHLLALGVLAPIVMGALTQMAPVVLGVKLPPAWALGAAHAGVAGGGLVLAAGFATARQALMLGGGSLAALGLAAFAGMLANAVRREARWEPTAVALVAALGFWAAGGILGLAMATNMRWGFSAGLASAMPLHAHVLLVGWLTLLTAAVSYKLLPMFTLAYGHPEASARWVLGLLAVGALAWLGALWWPPLWAVGALASAAGALGYGLDAWRLLKRRTPRRLDAGLSLAVAALGLLPVLAGLGAAAVAGVPRAGLAYGWLLLAGWAAWTLVGYLYKIVPFLVWYHRFGRVSGAGPRPLASALVDARLARAASVALATGTLAGAVALLAGQAGPFRAGATLAAAGGALAAGDLLASVIRKGGV